MSSQRAVQQHDHNVASGAAHIPARGVIPCPVDRPACPGYGGRRAALARKPGQEGVLKAQVRHQFGEALEDRGAELGVETGAVGGDVPYIGVGDHGVGVRDGDRQGVRCLWRTADFPVVVVRRSLVNFARRCGRAGDAETARCSWRLRRLPVCPRTPVRASLSLSGFYWSGIQLPWRPRGMRAGRWTRATGWPVKSWAARMTRSAAPRSGLWTKAIT